MNPLSRTLRLLPLAAAATAALASVALTLLLTWPLAEGIGLTVDWLVAEGHA